MKLLLESVRVLDFLANAETATKHGVLENAETPTNHGFLENAAHETARKT